jgi:hypothetical protein
MLDEGCEGLREEGGERGFGDVDENVFGLGNC